MTLTKSSLSRRDFLKTAYTAGLALGISEPGVSALANKKSKYNLVIITTDDNDAESLGCYGCPLPNITPNLDRLASEGVRFDHAHTSSPTCQPSRLSLMTGKYPQTNGNTGHVDPLREGVPTLASILGTNGYYTAIIGKQPNYLPESAFNWSRNQDEQGDELTADTWDDSSDGYWGMWRAPEGFYKGTRFLVSEAREKKKPFFLHLNTSDPHRPWPGNIDEVYHLTRYETKNFNKKGLPLRPYAKNYSPCEIPLPGYLPDLPGVRVDVAEYYSALHNGDKAVGRILDALREEKVLDDTIIIYFADQGAPFPMSKQSLYPAGTRIPLIIKWPGVTEKNRVISSTMVSIIDVMPTILEGLGISSKNEMDGKSILSLLQGKSDHCRDYIFTSYTYARTGLQAFPMRAVQSKQYLYIYNSWCGESNVEPPYPLVYDGVIDPLTGFCWESMKKAAARDAVLKKRVEFIKRRAPEEFYDLSHDPYCLNNVMKEDRYHDKIQFFKNMLEEQMVATNDPIIDKFRGTGPLPKEWLTRKK